MAGKASKLIRDLSNVPSIVGGLGLSIAEAQKAFNLDYLDSLERLLGMTKALLEPKAKEGGGAVDLGETAAVVKDMLIQLAPSRYQFTETTLTVKLDLAQTLDVGGAASFGANLGAVAVNASMTLGYGYDYRAAAEVRTILHAVPTGSASMTTLLEHAATLGASALTLPEGAQVDKDLVEKATQITSKLVDKQIAPPKEPEVPPADPGDPQ